MSAKEDAIMTTNEDVIIITEEDATMTTHEDRDTSEVANKRQKTMKQSAKKTKVKKRPRVTNKSNGESSKRSDQKQPSEFALEVAEIQKAIRMTKEAIVSANKYLSSCSDVDYSDDSEETTEKSPDGSIENSRNEQGDDDDEIRPNRE